MASTKKTYAFHVSKDNGAVRNHGGRMFVGVVHVQAGSLKMCERGLHASPTIADAAQYRFLKPGRVISLVEMSGNVAKKGNKIVARKRKVLAVEVVPSSYSIPTETKRINTGFNVIEVKVPQKSWLESIEKKLRQSYKDNKKTVDRTNTEVKLDA